MEFQKLKAQFKCTDTKISRTIAITHKNNYTNVTFSYHSLSVGLEKCKQRKKNKDKFSK